MSNQSAGAIETFENTQINLNPQFDNRAGVF